MDWLPIDFQVICSVFLIILAIDKLFYHDRLPILNDNRNWQLPLLALIIGMFSYAILNQVEYNSKGFLESFYYGILLGSLATISYRIIKKSIYEKIKILFRTDIIDSIDPTGSKDETEI